MLIGSGCTRVAGRVRVVRGCFAVHGTGVDVGAGAGGAGFVAGRAEQAVVGVVGSHDLDGVLK